MHIALSSARQVMSIPEEGRAILAGYVSADAKRGGSGPVLLKWREGKIASLVPLALGCLDRADEYPFASTREGAFAIAAGSQDQVHNWSDYWLIPGFVDAHVHLALDSIDFNRCLEQWNTPSQIEEKMQRDLRRYLERGIVAIRDGGDLPGFAWKAKEYVAQKRWLGPRVISVREAVARRGMYGRFLGRGFADLADWLMQEEGFFNLGLDQLKVVVSGIIRFDQYGVVGPDQWTLEELKALVESAHERGVKVMAHASGVSGIALAIEAGVDSIEHGYYMTREQLYRMVRKGIAWVPTVAPVGNILTYATERYGQKEKDVLRKIVENHLQRIQEAYELKVLLGIGTDAGAYLVPHADAFWDELNWFAQAGLPWTTILKIATRDNGVISGLPDYGKLDIGADLSRLQLVYQGFISKFNL